MSEGAVASMAANLRRLRHREGLSVVELARRAGTARATVTQLESGAGNPTLETLYALANALGAPLADLITQLPPPGPTRVVPAGSGTRVLGAAVEALLLDTTADPAATTEIYDFRLHSAAAQRSAAHPRGTRESLHVYTGRIRIGPVEDTVEVGAGDFVCFDASREHLYQRLGRARVQGLLVISHSAT